MWVETSTVWLSLWRCLQDNRLRKICSHVSEGKQFPCWAIVFPFYNRKVVLRVKYLAWNHPATNQRGRIPTQVWTREPWFFSPCVWALHCAQCWLWQDLLFAHQSSDSDFDFLRDITVKWPEQMAHWATRSTLAGNSCPTWETRADWMSWAWRSVSHGSKCIRRSWCVFLEASCSKMRLGQGDLCAASLGSLYIGGLRAQPWSLFWLTSELSLDLMFESSKFYSHLWFLLWEFGLNPLHTHSTSPFRSYKQSGGLVSLTSSCLNFPSLAKGSTPHLLPICRDGVLQSTC